ncbi:hypothetical protein HDU96_003625 [Phlyctochytrium bullatum]|nr:hypothetical protein HDU96_003625 [Phlyctochytrium bullatum]
MSPLVGLNAGQVAEFLMGAGLPDVARILLPFRVDGAALAGSSEATLERWGVRDAGTRARVLATVRAQMR